MFCVTNKICERSHLQSDCKLSGCYCWPYFYCPHIKRSHAQVIWTQNINGIWLNCKRGLCPPVRFSSFQTVVGEERDMTSRLGILFLHYVLRIHNFLQTVTYLVNIEGSETDEVSGWLRLFLGPVVQPRSPQYKVVFLPALFGICLKEQRPFNLRDTHTCAWEELLDTRNI